MGKQMNKRFNKHHRRPNHNNDNRKPHFHKNQGHRPNNRQGGNRDGFVKRDR